MSDPRGIELMEVGEGMLGSMLSIIAMAGAVLFVMFTIYIAFDHFNNPYEGPWPVQYPDFKTPKPKPTDITPKSLPSPLPYRPFRHGKQHVTMGIRSMDWNNWIEMDSNFERYHTSKLQQLNRGKQHHIQYVNNNQTKMACHEMYEELVAYLTERYPKIFKMNTEKWTGEDGRLITERKVVTNEITGEAFPFPAENPRKALEYAGLLVQDDLILMVKNKDDSYHLDAACVTLNGFWRLREKFRTSLDHLHHEAKVAHYDSNLKVSMNRHFEKMVPDRPIIRNNFFIQLDSGLPWSTRMGPQDGTQVASWETANSEGLTIEELHFRSERQSLRRLPKSGAIMFTVRTYFEPVTKIAEEPHVPGRLAEAIRGWDDEVKRYKGCHHWEELLLSYLDKKHEEQVKSGILEKVQEKEFPF